MSLSKQLIQDSFYSYLKSSLTQAKIENLLDVDVLSSAEGDLTITGMSTFLFQEPSFHSGPALCWYFAALCCTMDPPSVPLPHTTSSSTPMDLSYENCSWVEMIMVQLTCLSQIFPICQEPDAVNAHIHTHTTKKVNIQHSFYFGNKIENHSYSF